MRVADFVTQYLSTQGVTHVFMVTGGGMMFLSDAVACHTGLQAVCNHHEQASAMAAVAFAKYAETLGCAFLTTGCGGTNAVTGVLNAWQDNTACIFVSGQSKRKETVRNSGLHLRQFGVQEADIIAIVESITKYAVMVNDPADIAFHIEKAVHLARSGRPGPVWLDIPLDVQGAQVDTASLRHFVPDIPTSDRRAMEDQATGVASELATSTRPIILAGQGVRLAGMTSVFRQLVDKHGIPVVATHLGTDLLPAEHPCYVGRVGNKGDRAGNFAIQNADVLLVLGSRLSVNSTGHEYSTFARKARTVVVDIDPEEHRKNTVRIDSFIEADLRELLPLLVDRIHMGGIDAWRHTCQRWKTMWPVCLPSYSAPGPVNLYYFAEILSRCLRSDDVVVSDAGSAFYVCAQGLRLNSRQRLVTSGGQAEMGFTLPAAIGVSMARKRGEVIGITGDGSLQMNLQELQVLVHHKLPVKLFVWNNDGYLSIRSTQARFFEKRFIGTDSSSGISFPSIGKLAEAYGIRYVRIDGSQEVESGILKTLSFHEPVLCEVFCQRDQEIVPAVASVRLPDGTMRSRPLEDMYPFLPREELQREMLIEPLP